MNHKTYPSGDYSPAMQTSSLILGIFSLLLIMTGLSFVIGAIGAILALLSRGSGKMRGMAVAGLITSLIGIGGSLIVLSSSLAWLFSDGPDHAMEKLNTLYEEYYEYYYGDSDSGIIENSGDNGNSENTENSNDTDNSGNTENSGDNGNSGNTENSGDSGNSEPTDPSTSGGTLLNDTKNTSPMSTVWVFGKEGI